MPFRVTITIVIFLFAGTAVNAASCDSDYGSNFASLWKCNTHDTYYPDEYCTRRSWWSLGICNQWSPDCNFDKYA